MSKGLKVRALVAAVVLVGCGVGLAMTANRQSTDAGTESKPATVTGVSAASRAPNNDVARRVRRVVRRRAVVVS